VAFACARTCADGGGRRVMVLMAELATASHDRLLLLGSRSALSRP
jgi:hypothetical protein